MKLPALAVEGLRRTVDEELARLERGGLVRQPEEFLGEYLMVTHRGKRKQLKRQVRWSRNFVDVNQTPATVYQQMELAILDMGWNLGGLGRGKIWFTDRPIHVVEDDGEVLLRTDREECEFRVRSMFAFLPDVEIGDETEYGEYSP